MFRKIRRKFPISAGWKTDTVWRAAADGRILSYIHACRNQSIVSTVLCLPVDLHWWRHAAWFANELVSFSLC